MNHFSTLKPLLLQTDSRIIVLVLDGLGGLPRVRGGPTELEAARTPNMDALAAGGMLGLSVPIAPGVTPGSTQLVIAKISHLSSSVTAPVLKIGIGSAGSCNIDVACVASTDDAFARATNAVARITFTGSNGGTF